MWETVDEMEKRHGLVPQFHGKWPFHRVLGLQVCTVYSVQYVQLSLQEPASVLFSVLNLLSNLGMLIWFMGTVPSNCSMYRCWLFYSFTAINAWVWSTVFHARYVQCTVCTVYSMYSMNSMYSVQYVQLYSVQYVQYSIPGTRTSPRCWTTSAPSPPCWPHFWSAVSG